MNLPLYLLDTDISSYIIKEKPQQVAKIFYQIPPEQICISSITHAEILYGLEKLPSNHPLQQRSQTFLRNMTILKWGDDKACECYAKICHYLISTGQTIGEMDMMIASHALALKAILVTNNTRHYQRIVSFNANLKIENWAE